MESQGRSAQHGGACARAAHAHNVSTWRGVRIAPALVVSGRLLELERQTSASLIPEHLLTGKWYRPHRDESAGTFQTPAGRQLLFVSPAASASAQARHQFSATAFRGTSHGLRGRPLHSRAVRTAERVSQCRRTREGASNSARRDGPPAAVIYVLTHTPRRVSAPNSPPKAGGQALPPGGAPRTPPPGATPPTSARGREAIAPPHRRRLRCTLRPAATARRWARTTVWPPLLPARDAAARYTHVV